MFGLYVLILPSGKHINLQIAYYFSKTAFLILLLISVLYIYRSSSSFSNEVRNLREHIVYMSLYGYIFVFIAVIIKFELIYNIKLAKAISAYLYLFYIVLNTVSLYFNHIVPHNAYLACVGMLLFSNVLYNFLYTRQQSISFLYTLFVIVILFSMPILAFLRGATFTTILILVTQLFFLSRNRIRNITVIILIGAFTTLILSSNFMNDYFKETNIYEYESALEMSNALTQSDHNKDVRFIWWKEAIGNSISSPVIGYAYSYSFSSIGNSAGSAAALHNYYLSMIVDTGYITFLLYLYILLLATFNGIKRIKSGDTTCIKYISWNVALISTYSTNCYGHVWSASSVMGLLHAYAIIKLLTPSPKTQQIRATHSASNIRHSRNLSIK